MSQLVARRLRSPLPEWLDQAQEAVEEFALRKYRRLISGMSWDDSHKIAPSTLALLIWVLTTYAPRNIADLGCGLSSLVLRKSLYHLKKGHPQRYSKAQIVSYDHDYAWMFHIQRLTYTAFDMPLASQYFASDMAPVLHLGPYDLVIMDQSPPEEDWRLEHFELLRTWKGATVGCLWVFPQWEWDDSPFGLEQLEAAGLQVVGEPAFGRPYDPANFAAFAAASSHPIWTRFE